MSVGLMPAGFSHTDNAAAIVYEFLYCRGNHRIAPPFAAGMCRIRITHIDDHIDLIAENKAARNRLFHRIRSQAICAGQINQMYSKIVILNGPLDLFYSSPRPVCNLQIGTGIRIEQRGFSTVWISDKSNRHFIVHSLCPPQR